MGCEGLDKWKSRLRILKQSFPRDRTCLESGTWFHEIRDLR